MHLRDRAQVRPVALADRGGVKAAEAGAEAHEVGRVLERGEDVGEVLTGRRSRPGRTREAGRTGGLRNQ